LFELYSGYGIIIERILGGEFMEKEILELLKSMQSDIKSMKTTQEEHTQILRDLEHKTDVVSAQ